MTSQTISRRYAKALLAIGQEDGDFVRYGEELAAFTAVMANRDLAEALANPIYPAGNRHKILDAILAKLSLSKIMQNFLGLLQDKERIDQVEDISINYQRLVDEINNIKRATVTTAGSISEPVLDQVKKSLEDMTGKSIILEAKQDPEIIGGIMAQVGDLTLDGSVKTQLSNLKESLIKG